MSKPSHYVTPRTTRDATWAAWGEAIERPDEREWRLLHLVIAIIGVAAAVAILLGLI